MHSTSALLIATLALTAPPVASSVPSDSQRAVAPHCVVTLINEAQVPAREAGSLMAIMVREGAAVQAGAVLAQIDDRDAQVRKRVAEVDYQVAVEQAKEPIRIQAAEASNGVDRFELEKAREVNRNNATSYSVLEVKRLELKEKHSSLQIVLARTEHESSRLTVLGKEAQVDGVENEIARLKVESPLDGVVAQVFKHTGEWVNPGDAIMRVVRMDKLRVEGFLDVDEYSRTEVAGRPVTVEVRLTRGRIERFSSTIDFVSPLVEASGHYRIWAEVENRMEAGHWLLRPGLTAEMSIHLEAPVATPTSRVSSTRQ
jgi:macrolide-specific efflux system membrane fusion protein